MAGLISLRRAAFSPEDYSGRQALKSCHSEFHHLALMWSFFCAFYFPMAKQDYILKNRQWLEAKAQEPEVKPLDKGVFYKVIKKGDQSSATPNRGSVVTAHYTGKTINGKTFDSSRGGVAPAFRLRELIPGWIIALQQMHIGDKWEVYIPAEMAYGKSNQPGIPGGSTLIFEIELLGIA